MRAARTFLQAALGYAVANIAGVAEDGGITKKALAILLTASVAAGLAAVMNLPKRGGNDKAKEDSKGE